MILRWNFRRGAELKGFWAELNSIILIHNLIIFKPILLKCLLLIHKNEIKISARFRSIFSWMDKVTSRAKLTIFHLGSNSSLSVGGCWGQSMLFFWKLVDETLMSKPPEATRYHFWKKIIIPSNLQSHLVTSISLRLENGKPLTMIHTVLFFEQKIIALSYIS